LSAARGSAWTNGELLIWISDNRAYHALVDLGKAFEKEVGATVKVETQEQINEKFQAAVPGCSKDKSVPKPTAGNFTTKDKDFATVTTCG
jgi:hypothetical protein